MSPVLGHKEIAELLKASPPLLEEYINLQEQMQPNGFDLSLREISMFTSPGRVEIDNAGREISRISRLSYDASGYMRLEPGSYLVTFNEIVHLPLWLMALGRPRTTLLRCGVAIHTAVWDAGYSGRSQALMVVYNSAGFRVQRNARLMQLVFFHLSSADQGYRGIYQNENIM